MPPWLWLWLPLALYSGYYLVHALMPAVLWDRWVLHELGFTEQATVAVLALALGVGLAVLWRVRRLRKPGLLVFFGLFCLGCLYFGGEEASWGQHWFGWQAADAWNSGKQETNLHNMVGYGWVFNELPRSLLVAAIFISGVCMPLWRRWKQRPLAHGSTAALLLPGLECVPLGLIASLGTLPQKAARAITGEVPWLLQIDPSEVKELMIALFLLIYICAASLRVQAGRGG